MDARGRAEDAGHQFGLFLYLSVAAGFHRCTASSSSRRRGCSLHAVCWLLLLRSMGSRHTGFSSCGLWALERAGFMSCTRRLQNSAP